MEKPNSTCSCTPISHRPSPRRTKDPTHSDLQRFCIGFLRSGFLKLTRAEMHAGWMALACQGGSPLHWFEQTIKGICGAQLASNSICPIMKKSHKTQPHHTFNSEMNMPSYLPPTNRTGLPVELATKLWRLTGCSRLRARWRDPNNRLKAWYSIHTRRTHGPFRLLACSCMLHSAATTRIWGTRRAKQRLQP